MNIVQAPSNVLSQKAQRIGKIDKDVLKLIEDMKYTLIHATDPEGIGLAAPQVGKSIQLFIVKEDQNAPFFVFINPLLTPLSEQKKTMKKKEHEKDNKLEGCLSLKDIWGTVERSQKVHISWTDEQNTHHEQEFTGFFATILQHEYDHLQGILFPRRVLEQKGQLYKSHKDKTGHEVFDPLEI